MIYLMAGGAWLAFSALAGVLIGRTINHLKQEDRRND